MIIRTIIVIQYTTEGFEFIFERKALYNKRPRMYPKAPPSIAPNTFSNFRSKIPRPMPKRKPMMITTQGTQVCVILNIPYKIVSKTQGTTNALTSTTVTSLSFLPRKHKKSPMTIIMIPSQILCSSKK